MCYQWKDLHILTRTYSSVEQQISVASLYIGTISASNGSMTCNCQMVSREERQKSKGQSPQGLKAKHSSWYQQFYL